MKKLLSVLLLTAMMSVMLCACGGSKGIKFGTNAEFPPFEYVTAAGVIGEYDGIDMAIAKEIGVQSGMDISIENMEFDSLLIALENGELTIRHGSDITVKGLSRGEYTLTESGAAVMSAKIGDEEQAVTDNSMTIADLHENTKVDITNKMPPIAPTGFDFDCHPFVMLLGLGAALALIFKAGRRRRED